MSDEQNDMNMENADMSDLDQLVDAPAEDTGYEKAAFDDLQASPAAASAEPASSAPAADVNLDMVLDLSVTLSMEVGRTQISIGDLLQLNQGSVIELDRLAGEPLDVMVNGTLVAHGEVVVVNEKFGIYLTDVVDPAERVKKLRS